MQRLSAEKILAVWEAGRPQHALDRALTVLAAASPGASRAALADLSIGERDALLLQLRALSFGPHAEGFAECPRCAERVEFPLDTSTISPEGRASARPTIVPAHHEVEMNGSTIRFRLATSRDLAEVVAAPDSSQALRLLVERCILSRNEGFSAGPDRTERTRGSASLPRDMLPYVQGAPAGDVEFSPADDETIAAVSRAMLETDPQAEITLRLTCPSCRHEWELLFDIVQFFWTEISAQAQRLLREIDILARTYGWTEREILSLPTQRRQTYLELATA
ncbi:MAG: hypothetical protein WCE51_04455 [Chthoniobacterales bacterium]